MSVNNLFADCQTNPCSRVFATRVEPLKDQENAVKGFGINANAIIRYRTAPLVALLIIIAADPNGRWLCTAKFNGIGD
jgi:hypothetical protein